MIIKWSSEDFRFLVTVSQLPGCRTDGRTYEEAVINASIIISEWIDTAKKQEGLYLVSQNKTTKKRGTIRFLKHKQLILPSDLSPPGRDQLLLPGTCQSAELPRSPQNQVHQAQTTGGHLLSPYQISFPENPPCLE